MPTHTYQRDSPSPTGVFDTAIAQGAANNSNNTITLLLVGATNDTSRRRPLLRFAITDIPTSASVTSAKLELTNYAGYSATTAECWSLAGAGERQWTETCATWNKYDNVTLWGAAGGDLRGFLKSVTLVDQSSGFPSIPLPTSAVQEAISAGSGEFDCLLLQQSGPPANVQRNFRSSDDPTVASRPKLTVVWESSPTTEAQGNAGLTDASLFQLQNGTWPDATYTGCRDAQMSEAEPTTSGGAAATMRVENLITVQDFQSLVRFNTSGLDDLAWVQAAHLNLWNEGGTYGTGTIACYEASGTGGSEWTQPGVTWDSYDAGLPWPVAGGVAGTLWDAIGFTNTEPRWHHWDVRLATTAALAGSDVVNLLLVGTTNNAKRTYQSSEGTDATLRPKLKVWYYPPVTSEGAGNGLLSGSLAQDGTGNALLAGALSGEAAGNALLQGPATSEAAGNALLAAAAISATSEAAGNALLAAGLSSETAGDALLRGTLSGEAVGNGLLSGSQSSEASGNALLAGSPTGDAAGNGLLSGAISSEAPGDALLAGSGLGEVAGNSLLSARLSVEGSGNSLVAGTLSGDSAGNGLLQGAVSAELPGNCLLAGSPTAEAPGNALLAGTVSSEAAGAALLSGALSSESGGNGLLRGGLSSEGAGNGLLAGSVSSEAPGNGLLQARLSSEGTGNALLGGGASSDAAGRALCRGAVESQAAGRAWLRSRRAVLFLDPGTAPSFGHQARIRKAVLR